ncbi:hypothetical protein FKM82_022767, partial [Ascaphus truei]
HTKDTFPTFSCLQPVTVETPQGTLYQGKSFHRQRITGVSILRAGETMEQALTAVCKDIRLGKILIQTNHNTGEPEVRAGISLSPQRDICVTVCHLHFYQDHPARCPPTHSTLFALVGFLMKDV